MNIFMCEDTLESLISCIYEAMSSKLGFNNIHISTSQTEEYSLFNTYRQCEYNPEYFTKLQDAINTGISPLFFSEITILALSDDPNKGDLIYRMLLMGFKFGETALNMTVYEPVMDFIKARKKLTNEAYHFREFLRFHDLGMGRYVAHIEPHSRILLLLAENFMDRMPSEHFMIVDDVHLEAVIHPKNSDYYIRSLTRTELEELKKTEAANDGFTDLWKVFFNSIAIKERENYICQRNHFPIWKRAHAVEFI